MFASISKNFLAAVLFLILSHNAYASGYRPAFDEALSVAKEVVLGKVIEAWDPVFAEGVTPDPDSPADEGRVYRMLIQKTYKGSLLSSEEVVFWDPNYMSTAGYSVDEGEVNLLFLVRAEGRLSSFEKKHLHFRTKTLYRPIQSVSKDGYRKEKFTGWLRILETLRRYSSDEKRAAFESLLATENNEYILRYVVNHWPVPMTKEDDALFMAAVKKHSKNAAITRPIIKVLFKREVGFADDDLLWLLREGSEYQRGELLSMINPKNIDLCKSIIFDWFMEERPASEQETIDVLVKLAPDYLKAQLRERELPFWKMIPCLQALQINGRDIGKDDFSPEILALDPSEIRDMGEVFRGKEFHGVSTMGSPRQTREWSVALSLFEPLLSGANTPIRRLIVALFRTAGVSTERVGEKYIAKLTEELESKPVRLEFEKPTKVFVLGEPVVLTLKEIATREGWFSFQGELERVVSGPEWTTHSGGGYRIWDDVDLAKDKFSQLVKGYTVSSKHSFEDLISRPGTYTISVEKTYPHDGGSVDVDAWTGVLFSEPVVIKVVEGDE